MQISRRQMLAGMAGLLAVSQASTLLPSAALANAPAERFAQIGGDFSWVPKKVDLDEVATLAHMAFHHKGYG